MSQTLKLETKNSISSVCFLQICHSQKKIPIDKSTLTIGRAKYCDITLDDSYLSKQHCKIEKRINGYFLKDLASTNGTKINGVYIKEAQLKDGDLINFGRSSIKFIQNLNAIKPQLLGSKNLAFQRQLDFLPQLAQSEFPLLITGPSGTGKEIIASQIHKLSKRATEPFITINCSALTESLIESELFGHSKGSFTGAENARLGAFETARNGTLFLDEIGDLPLSLQPKLLRALENSEIKAVGSDKVKKINVRIISATHKNLESLVESQKFREDLFYRLSVLQFHTPPLKRRKEDIVSFIYYFSKEFKVSLSHLAIKRLEQVYWPGNIRQLKNTIAKISVFFSNKTRVSEDDVNFLLSQSERKSSHSKSKEIPLYKKNEFQLIHKMLHENHGNQRKTALDLGMPKSTLHDKIKSYNLNIEDYK
jgi:transcriptional regulator with PAS, ATPase and Fis domain